MNGHGLYIATGTSLDWAFGEAEIDLSFCYEFRDLNTFILPAEQIIPNAQETMQSLIGMIHESERLHRLP